LGKVEGQTGNKRAKLIEKPVKFHHVDDNGLSWVLLLGGLNNP
jgi:hypothetical protein